MAAQALHAVSCPFLWHAALGHVNPQLAPTSHVLGVCASAIMAKVLVGQLHLPTLRCVQYGLACGLICGLSWAVRTSSKQDQDPRGKHCWGVAVVHLSGLP